MNSPLPPALLQRLQEILRRDLKLGPNTPIPPDMPFFGGDFDLDSLDILLLVTSIEKEFGVKIPSSDVGKEVFQNVTTLGHYVSKNLGNASPAEADKRAPANTIDPLTLLPHADPFRFVSSVTRIDAGSFAEGEWNVSGEEAFFAGHFPNNPLLPGVLITEALAQISGLAGGETSKGGMLAEVAVRFLKPVAPPAKIALSSKLSTTMGSLQKFDVTATVNGEQVASGSITLHRM